VLACKPQRVCERCKIRVGGLTRAGEARGWYRGAVHVSSALYCPHCHTHTRERATMGIEQRACTEVWSGSHTAPTQHQRMARPGMAAFSAFRPALR
jgi:ribosomal protein L37AE/L43A